MIFQNTEHKENQDIIQIESSFTAKNEDVSDFKENSKNICNTYTDTSVATFEKDIVACRSKETEEYTQENIASIERHLNEGLGTMSFAVSGNFGRFIVVGVERNIYQREMYESYIKEGDIVHILFSEEVNSQFYVSDHKGIVVVNPDYLISGTSVVSAVFCPRKSVLNERFKGYDGGNKIMIIGSLVHQLFQDIVTKKICEEADIMALINDLVSHPRVLKEFYGLNISASEVLEDMKQFVPLIKSWNENYLKSGSNCGQIPEKNWTGKIAAVKDIEENFWSPRFGLKGKIDLTVEAEI
ncbi:DNA replication ATP-dependent helicase/nuclease DNA2 [Armadillidium vulgare]|nr:DNA replication ATP-dependent helicase/nuclease DNA2 [Armadillidium vulgare]